MVNIGLQHKGLGRGTVIWDIRGEEEGGNGSN